MLGLTSASRLKEAILSLHSRVLDRKERNTVFTAFDKRTVDDSGKSEMTKRTLLVVMGPRDEQLCQT
jgi:hypothetical protein